MRSSAALPLLLVVAGCTAVPLPAAGVDPQHSAVRDLLVTVMNNFSRVDDLLPMFDNSSEWCDPYPTCYQGLAGDKSIPAFLHSLPSGTQAMLLPETMVINGPVAGLLCTVSFVFPGDSPSCLYTAEQHVSWRIRGAAAEAGGGGVPQLEYLRWVYNASAFDVAARGCAGAAAPPAPRRASVPAPGAGAALQEVYDYVLYQCQYSPQTWIRICDLLAPGARYCDPYPTDCVTGPAACRAELARAGRSARWSRPSSVRPLMRSGPATGAMYVHFSEVGNDGAATLHRTFALWTLANSSSLAGVAAGPAPLLSRWDWFYTERQY